MNITIVGAGAIGGLIGTRLALAGHTVSAIARGATRAALQQHGWRLRTTTDQGERLLQAPCAAAVEDAAALGPQELVVIAVKAPALATVSRQVATLLGAETLVLPAMNGVPWWFGRGVPGLEAPLVSVDPGAVIASTIPFQQVIGCVVHASTATPEPGLAHLRMGNRLVIGEPAGGVSARARVLGDVLASAGFDAPVSTDVRHDIWYKLWGNMTMNPVSAITGATADRVLADPLVRAFCSAAMAEAAAVGAHIGCPIAESPEDRHQVTAKLGAFKTSMLQDVEAGRPIELDALVTVVREIAQRVGVATPSIDALLGLTRLFGCTHGLYAWA